MKVTVQHASLNPISGAVIEFVDVAEVNVWHLEDVNGALRSKCWN